MLLCIGGIKINTANQMPTLFFDVICLYFYSKGFDLSFKRRMGGTDFHFFSKPIPWEKRKLFYL